MALTGLVDLVRQGAGFRGLLREWDEREGGVELRLPQGAHALVAAALQREQAAPMLLLAPGKKLVRNLYGDLAVWHGADAPVHLFAELEDVPLERAASDPHNEHLRLRALDALHSGGSGAVVVAAADALLTPTLPPERFQSATVRIAKGDTLDGGMLLRRAAAAGYTVAPAVDAPGSVSRRGYIIDAFPATSDTPVRIELFGDEVESMRYFDPVTQRSIGQADSVVLRPAREMLLEPEERAQLAERIGALDWSGVRDEERAALLEGAEDSGAEALLRGAALSHSLLDHLPEGALVVQIHPDEMAEAGGVTAERLARLLERKRALGDLPPDFPLPRMEWQRAGSDLERRKTLRVLQWGVGRSPFSFSAAPFAAASMEDALPKVAEEHRRGRRVVVVSSYSPRIAELLAGEVPKRLNNKLPRPPKADRVNLIQDRLRQGFLLKEPGEPELLVLTDAELLGLAREHTVAPYAGAARRKRRETHLDELRPGMHLVHSEHGIARFGGMRTMGEHKGEYLVLEYAAEDKLYLPVAQIEKVEIYKSPSGAAPRLTRLNSQEWRSARKRALKAVELYASELLTTAAMRGAGTGFAHGEDGHWQAQMEQAFPFQETPDQARAISEVKADMESKLPMDRLLCGDVGYGKTEVALRAAFKAVCSGRQVAILSPTTLLTRQHYETFSQRFAPFPVKIGMLSALVKPADQRRVAREAAAGKVDVLIGTHRLLQRDIALPKLGLVVVDEEHRFGVRQKERLKKMRAQVDMLSMSATPIPRSLHMAMSGVRSISQIETAPAGRLAPRTYVVEHSGQIVAEAVRHELERSGQVFALHNHVESLDKFADELQRAVPEARIGIAHGQMDKGLLEQVTADFVRHEYDILACTTIIEAGIDIPNVNTLLVDRADQFGLSQLHQLRGRIGRRHSRGYAYFMLRGTRITDVAAERLNAILEASELGMGFQIAMRDLQIRGAGNLLGAAQSGHIEAIGMDLYTKMLKAAIREMSRKGAKQAAEQEDAPPGPEIDLDMPRGIPPEYIPSLPQRFNIYRRLARLDKEERIADLAAELRDRFGPLPAEVELVFAEARLRIEAGAAGVSHISHRGERTAVWLQDSVGGAQPLLQRQLEGLGLDVQVGSKQIVVRGERQGAELIEGLQRVMRGLAEFRERLIALAEAASGG